MDPQNSPRPEQILAIPRAFEGSIPLSFCGSLQLLSNLVVVSHGVLQGPEEVLLDL